MKLGLIARCENRGLGIQTWEVYRHLPFDRVLVVDMRHRYRTGEGYEHHFDRYPGALILRDDQMCDETVRPWLAGLDVVFTAETPYWFGLYDLARELGVKTVCQANPEFYRYPKEPHLPRPDVILNPSTWLMERMPGAAHLPLPVDRDRIGYRHRTEARTFLHVAGHRAIHDRNGTRTVMGAIGKLREPCRVVIRSQSPLPTSPFAARAPRHVEVDVRVGDVDDYWRLYDEGDVFLAPRRYGGQSLPLNEAAAAGMAILTTDCEPQRSMLPPEALLPAWPRGRFDSQSGEVEVMDVVARVLAARMDELVRDPSIVERLSKASDGWAESISWGTLRPRYMALFSDLL